jgi:hypothetical protein
LVVWGKGRDFRAMTETAGAFVLGEKRKRCPLNGYYFDSRYSALGEKL